MAATYTKLRWVWTTKLASPTAHGSAQRSPVPSDHSQISSAQNGRIMAWGCQASKSSSLPSVHASAADSAVTTTIASRPPARRAATAASTMAATLATATPTAIPTEGPSAFTNGASTSNHSGPGLLIGRPVVSDADVHVPSHGWCDVATSWLRSRIRPLSPTGVHPRVSVRTVATTTGSAATTTRTPAARSSRRAGPEVADAGARAATTLTARAGEA